MCGINGYWDIARKLPDEELISIIHKMNERIRYRGPNEDGVYLSDNICMGMRRLSIVDLNNGSQPIFNEDKTLAIVYNGEIYNYESLRDDLLKHGHSFVTNTDTEVIVHAFEEYGTECFDMFDGMFAFALYDVKEKRLFLVRDRMGEKPLYYTMVDGGIAFSSELNGLEAAEVISRKIDIRALNQYVQLTYIPAPLTIYENVFKLRPGHYIEVTSDGRKKDHEYWDIPICKVVNIPYKNAVKKISSLLKESVKYRMIGDVPIGMFLSGGIDSAGIVGLMREAGADRIKTYTIGFDNKDYDERGRAKQISIFNHTEHYERIMDSKMFLASFKELIQYMDEPFADSTGIGLYALSKYACDYVSVAISGDAGDELFMGYNKYLFAYYNSVLKLFPFITKKSIAKMMERIFHRDSLIYKKIKKMLNNTQLSRLDAHKALMHMGVQSDDMGAMMKSEFRDEKALDFIDDYYYKHKEATEIQKEQYIDLKIVLEGDMLVKTDRMCMLNSIEGRVPMLSKEIIEYVVNLPDKYKINKGKTKRILKDAIRPILPPFYDITRKHGFDIPIGDWITGELKKEIDYLMGREMIEKQGYFDYSYIERIKNEHFTGERDRSAEIWVIYVFEKWYERAMT